MATDQEIRDAGFKYVPKQKYLQDPFKLSTTPPDSTPDTPVVQQLGYQGGGNFSPYNPDPNSIVNKNYSPYAYRQAMAKSGVGIPSGILSNSEFLYGPKLEGIPGAIANYANNSLVGKGLSIAGNILGEFFPNNMQAKLVNELGGKGIMVNDIGQIVSGGGDYDTAGNVMSGYNTSKMTAKTFDDRIKSLGNMTAAGKEKRTKAILEAKKNFLDAQKQAGVVFDEEEEKKKKTFNFLKKKKTAEAETTTGTGTGTDTGTDSGTDSGTTTGGGSGGTVPTTDPNYTPVGPNQPDPVNNSSYEDQSYSGGGGGGGASYSNSAQTGAKDGFGYGLKKGGRAGYFFGGRVNYKAGGRIGFQGGGSDASSDDFGTSTSAPGPGDTGGEGGNNPSDGSDTQFGGGNNNGGASDNPPVTVVNNNPIDISTVTKSVGDYDIPYGLEALMADKGRLQAVLNADNILDKNIGAEFTYDQGPFSIGAYADMDGDKSLNANYINNAGSKYSFDLNEDGGRLKFAKAFANGGLAGLL